MSNGYVKWEVFGKDGQRKEEIERVKKKVDGPGYARNALGCT